MGEMTPLSVAGGYWTGSSAVVDLLSEHPQCQVVPDEFTLFTFGQFFQEVCTPILDGEEQVPALHRNLERLLSFNRSEWVLRRVVRRVLRTFHIYPKQLFLPRRGMSRRLGRAYSKACLDLASTARRLAQLSPADRDVSELGAAVLRVLVEATRGAAPPGDAGAGVGVFDQLVAPPFLSDAHKCVPQLRFVNVDRNWADQYLSLRDRYFAMVRRNRALGVRPWDERGDGPDPDPVAYFVRLREKIESVKREADELPQASVLWLEFEDVAYDTKRVAERLFEFLGLDPGLWTPGTRYDPMASRRRVSKPIDVRIRPEIARLEALLDPSESSDRHARD